MGWVDIKAKGICIFRQKEVVRRREPMISARSHTAVNSLSFKGTDVPELDETSRGKEGGLWVRVRVTKQGSRSTLKCA